MKKKIILVVIMVLLALFTASIAQSYIPGNWKLTLGTAVENLTHIEFYYSLANPTVTYVNIVEGMRKEQIAEVLAERFKWDEKDTNDFLGRYATSTVNLEGKYFPDTYLAPKGTSGLEFQKLMINRFNTKTKLIRDNANAGITNFDTALKIASLIQREAAGKSDMNIISGIIQNRLYRGMPLQIDATLQYVRGSKANGWWPEVDIKTKKLTSSYNTYKYKGLPPTPISNPGLAAINAALAPAKTSCLYYLHSRNKIYCSNTYAQHKVNIATYLSKK